MYNRQQGQFTPVSPSGFPGGGFPFPFPSGNFERRLDQLERQQQRTDRRLDQLERRVERIERRLGFFRPDETNQTYYY